MRRVSLLLFFFLAPFLGIALGLLDRDAFPLEIETGELLLPAQELGQGLDTLNHSLAEMQKGVNLLNDTIEEQQKKYDAQRKELQRLVQESLAQKNLSDEVYDYLLRRRLGEPIATHNSRRVQVLLYKLDENGYVGYVAKIKPYDPKAVRVVLSNDKLGESETTASAVERTGALTGINGGGFYSSVQDGQKYVLPIGNTMVNGKLINDFVPSYNDLFFAGFTKKGKLVGGIVNTREELMALSPYEGVSFVPILLVNREPLPIPAKWRQAREPRSVLGTYGNGDLILMVVDGRQNGYSIGVTLEDLQLKLISLGLVDAYNLDGGGSSTFVYDGKVLNRPSDGKQRAVTTHIVVYP